MPAYRCLNKQEFSRGAYSLVPLRYEDRFAIMRWRNQQLYHLRQSSPLTEEDQQRYFDQVVAGLFAQERPGQVLFSYLENGRCIGYGGLVHINWTDRHAEVSFVMETEREEKEMNDNSERAPLEKMATAIPPALDGGSRLPKA